MGAVEDTNKEIIRRWIGPADDGSGPFLLTDAALELLAEDAVWHLPPTAEIPARSRVSTTRRPCAVATPSTRSRCARERSTTCRR